MKNIRPRGRRVKEIPSDEKEKARIIIFQGKLYYKLKEHEKIKAGALHVLKYNSYDDESGLHTIKHHETIGKTPSQFSDRDFFNIHISDYKHKIEKFNINNLYLGESI